MYFYVLTGLSSKFFMSIVLWVLPIISTCIASVYSICLSLITAISWSFPLTLGTSFHYVLVATKCWFCYVSLIPLFPYNMVALQIDCTKKKNKVWLGYYAQETLKSDVNSCIVRTLYFNLVSLHFLPVWIQFMLDLNILLRNSGIYYNLNSFFL
jgi:hypothetical protein